MSPIPSASMNDGTPLVYRGLWDGTALIPATYRQYHPGSYVTPIPVVQTQKYGVSATAGSGPGFAAAYEIERAILHSNNCYYYDNTPNPTWDNVETIPSEDDIWFQVKSGTLASYRAMVASMPATRRGKVYLHYWNEPEDNVKRGEMLLSDWQQRTDWLFQAIAEHPTKTYIVPSVELQYWTLQKSLKGDYGIYEARNIAHYIRPGTKQIGWSAYAEKKLQKPELLHEVAATSPVTMPKVLKEFMATLPGIGWSVITGWALSTPVINDPISIQNRVDWFVAVAENLKVAGCEHFMWFNIPWAVGDYRIETDALLFQAWKDLLLREGQWAGDW